MHLLVVEDASASALTHLFTASGFECQFVRDGSAALAYVATVGTDMVVLASVLSDQDAVDVCGLLRERGFAGGIVMMSARGGELDIVAGLDAGADDYLVTPCSIAELQARVRAVLRRVERSSVSVDHAASHGRRLEVLDHQIAFEGIEIATPGREFDVLALLIEARGAVVTSRTLMDEVWGSDWRGSAMVLSSAVGRIRNRLRAAGSTEQVENVRGVGFRLGPA